MPENQGVWGVEIGQAGLKAIRLRYAEAAGQVIAVAFDYVPHPKILSQPDAVPDELIKQALETFLSRNDVRTDQLAISVPGQTAFIRFVQLPPVQANKVADIVKFEARQQIPFALEDVIWDYQIVSGGQAESDFMLDAEVGLFAMKRDQVQQHLRPFAERKIEPELIQAAPLSMYSVLSYDLLGIRKGDDTSGRDEYVILLDMGADNTTLLVSNGEKIWIRNVPIGGNHFTRALTKEMKLTFAKAEHLKCNATKSPDPRAVFQAMRPVFNDYVAEIQRSIGYFSSVNRAAKITKVVGVGNGFKLAGLQKFLQQNLQYPVERLETFQGMVGDAVLSAPLFDENRLTFVVPYGLALQALGLTRLHTSLLPPEILMARKIREKKPWAVAAAALLLCGLSLSAVGYANVWRSVSPERWDPATTKIEALKTKVTGFNTSFQAAVTEFNDLTTKGEELIRPLDTREHWLEVYKAVNESLPRPEGAQRDEKDISKQERIRLLTVSAREIPDAALWYQSLPPNKKTHMLSPFDKNNPPAGKAYLFTLQGVHHHYDETDEFGSGPLYVVNTLLKNLQQWTVTDEQGQSVDVRKLGITHATLTDSPQPQSMMYDPNAMKAQGSQFGGSEMGAPMMRPMPMMTAPSSGGHGSPGGGRPPVMRMPMGPSFGGHGGGGRSPLIPMPMGPMGEGGAEGAATGNGMQELHLTNFTLQFLWRPVDKEKRDAFTALHQFMNQEPKPQAATLDAAQQFFQQKNLTVTLTQELFDEYIKVFGDPLKAPPPETPAAGEGGVPGMPADGGGPAGGHA